jgi:putative membrane protein
MADPRVYFAAERTLLAWVRSGLTVIALGFVVSRFGLFLRLVALSHGEGAAPPHTHTVSNLLGIALVVLGAGLILAASYNHRCYIRALAPQDVPRLGIPWLSSALALALATLGLVMAGYLALA